MGLEIVPLYRSQARAFVEQHHRHNSAPVSDIIRVGLQEDGELVGVAIAEVPKARMSMDGRTLEISRVCVTTSTKNACSMLYGALARAAKALGWQRLITYTLESEPGSSPAGAGFKPVSTVQASMDGWGSRNAMQPDLFGLRRRPNAEPKVRWERTL